VLLWYGAGEYLQELLLLDWLLVETAVEERRLRR